MIRDLRNIRQEMKKVHEILRIYMHIIAGENANYSNKMRQIWTTNAAYIYIIPVYKHLRRRQTHFIFRHLSTADDSLVRNNIDQTVSTKEYKACIREK